MALAKLGVPAAPTAVKSKANSVAFVMDTFTQVKVHERSSDLVFLALPYWRPFLSDGFAVCVYFVGRGVVRCQMVRFYQRHKMKCF